MPANEYLRFPSGRSVANCRKDAKRLSRQRQIPLHEALDVVASENGVRLPWHQALATLTDSQLPHRNWPMTALDVRRIMRLHPELTLHGMSVFMGGVRSAFELEQRFREQREALKNSVEMCNRAGLFIRELEQRQTINWTHSSYGLKHDAEAYLYELAGEKQSHVANGAFICAAIHAGFRFERGEVPSANVWFNVSDRSAVLQWARLKRKKDVHVNINGSWIRAEEKQLVMLEDQLGLGKA